MSEIKALEPLLGCLVELHVLGSAGLGAVVTGRLTKYKPLAESPTCYKVELRTDGQAVAKAFFREEHFEAVTRQNCVWIRQ